MPVDIDAALAEFEGIRDKRKTCKVCESEWREFVDAALSRGAGAPSIRRFLAGKGFDLAHSTIERHKDHLSGPAQS